MVKDVKTPIYWLNQVWAIQGFKLEDVHLYTSVLSLQHLVIFH